MLIINFLYEEYKIYLSKEIFPSDTIILEDKIYFIDDSSKENDGFIGFFDWLRADEVTIVGIRLCFFEHHSYNEFLSQLPYLKPSFDNKCFELLFEGNEYDPNYSGDQDFANNYVYKSDKGGYLFTFGLDHLIPQELNTLKKYCEILGEHDLRSNF